MIKQRMARLRLILATVVFLALGALSYFLVLDHKILRPYNDSFARSDISEWTRYGGYWNVNDGTLDNVSGARGDKAVVGNHKWTDYVVESDLRINSDPAGSHWGDAGIIFRVTDPSIGVDAYDGYYVGIGLEDNVLLLGRSNYSWIRLSAMPLVGPAKRGTWYHLRLFAKGCYFEATTHELGSPQETRLTFFDNDCTKRNGAVGVRTFGVQASWRHFVVRAP